jgi:hypothetical protein
VLDNFALRGRFSIVELQLFSCPAAVSFNNLITQAQDCLIKEVAATLKQLGE